MRRRLFEPLAGPDAFKQRDVTARAFADLYHAQSAEFPPECKGGDYEKRIQAAYPIHPEIFDRLYTDWSTLVKFQRTRGVLRLMAAVIHSLWEKGDRNPLILPSTMPIDDARVQSELTRYLSDNWAPIIEKDVDGPNSLPLKIDAEQPNLGKLHATRRVARTIYLGSAPTAAAAHRGLEDRRVKLGCVMPGESPAVFGDALRRLAAAATYLYQDGPRFWYATQPTVTKLAEDRAEQLKRDPDKVAQELDERLRADLRKTGDFSRIHPLPRSGADVPDDLDARLVVLLVRAPVHQGGRQRGRDGGAGHSRVARQHTAALPQHAGLPRGGQGAPAGPRRGGAPVPGLEVDPRREGDAQPRPASGAAGRDAEAGRGRRGDGATARDLPVAAGAGAGEPSRSDHLAGDPTFRRRRARRASEQEAPERRASGDVARLHRSCASTSTTCRSGAATDVPFRQLVEDFARYLYLPRLAGPEVLVQAMRDGVALLTWQSDTFAYAESYDEAAGRYRGLRSGQVVTLSAETIGLLVKPDVARQQLEAEAPATSPGTGPAANSAGASQGQAGSGQAAPGAAPSSKPGATPAVVLRRYHGTVELDAARVGRDASKIADEVVAHLAGQVGAKVTVTLEISATLPSGASAHTVRTVTENSRSLKFTNHGFESD